MAKWCHTLDATPPPRWGRPGGGEPQAPNPHLYSITAFSILSLTLSRARNRPSVWQPARKGSKRGSAYAYNVKELRDREIEVARQAEQAYAQFVGHWQPRGPGKRRTGAANEERR